MSRGASLGAPGWAARLAAAGEGQGPNSLSAATGRAFPSQSTIPEETPFMSCLQRVPSQQVWPGRLGLALPLLVSLVDSNKDGPKEDKHWLLRQSSPWRGVGHCCCVWQRLEGRQGRGGLMAEPREGFRCALTRGCWPGGWETGSPCDCSGGTHGFLQLVLSWKGSGQSSASSGHLGPMAQGLLFDFLAVVHSVSQPGGNRELAASAPRELATTCRALKRP